MTERRKSDRRGQNQDYLMSDDQVANLAGVPVSTVRHWRQVGVLPFVKVGRHPRVWHSIFQKVFQKPISFWVGGGDKIEGAGDIRRAL
jgi:excisionase family DNA binding protein